MSTFTVEGSKVINLNLVQYFEIITTSDHDYSIKFIFGNQVNSNDGKLVIQYDNREEAYTAYNNLLITLGLDSKETMLNIG